MRISIKQYILFVLITIFIIGGLYLKLREYFLPEAVIKIAGQEVKVEIAKTPATWVKGLGGRKNLAENQGLLFIYPEASQRGFWMKGMNFPLDIIWINNGLAIDIAPNIQPAAPNDSNPQVYYPRLPAKAVLEVRAGFSEKWGVKIGDKVELTK